MKIETGVMVMLGDKAWGVVYEDGHCTQWGWVPIDKAPIHDPKFCKSVTDVTYANSPLIPVLRQGKLVRVERRTETIILDAEEDK